MRTELSESQDDNLEKVPRTDMKANEVPSEDPLLGPLREKWPPLAAPLAGGSAGGPSGDSPTKGQSAKVPSYVPNQDPEGGGGGTISFFL